jgi:hypothetical protein
MSEVATVTNGTVVALLIVLVGVLVVIAWIRRRRRHRADVRDQRAVSRAEIRRHGDAVVERAFSAVERSLAAGADEVTLMHPMSDPGLAELIQRRFGPSCSVEHVPFNPSLPIDTNNPPAGKNIVRMQVSVDDRVAAGPAGADSSPAEGADPHEGRRRSR